MSNMTEKPETGDDFPEQMMLFEELVEVSTHLVRWPQDGHDTTVRNLAADQVVTRQGSKVETVFKIISGTLKLSQVN